MALVTTLRIERRFGRLRRSRDGFPNSMITLNKGLDLPISGVPDQTIDIAPGVTRVGLLGGDYVGMKPTMAVSEGDRVKRGQTLFTDKKTEGVKFASPAAGTVVEVNRGAKRAFQSVVVEVDGDDAETFASYSDLASVTREQVVQNLVESGLWTSLRVRPFSRTPALDSAPRSIFVQAIDTSPLAVNPNLVIAERQAEFRNGLVILKKLTDGPVYLCKAPGDALPGEDVPGVKTEAFSGPHPAGLPGTHIHFLDPVGPGRKVWTIGYQDVIAIGHLFANGDLSTERVISLGGPQVSSPRLLRTVLGARVSEVTAGQIREGDNRVISGSVLYGRAVGSGPLDYLGRFHNQISVVEEGRHREFLGWQKPGGEKFSIKKVFVGALNGGRRFSMTTDRNGSFRAMVPVGSFEAVVPMDLEPTFLLRALLTNDTDLAQALGVLELDEEDVALCTYVCPGKSDYAALLRKNLTEIEREG